MNKINVLVIIALYLALDVDEYELVIVVHLKTGIIIVLYGPRL